jgi:preprotein translocase subunit SecG
MTYHDSPDTNRSNDISKKEDKTFDKTMMWLGGAFAVLIIVALIGWSTSSTNDSTASNPSATTGSSAPARR